MEVMETSRTLHTFRALNYFISKLYRDVETQPCDDLITLYTGVFIPQDTVLPRSPASIFNIKCSRIQHALYTTVLTPIDDVHLCNAK